jgi:hypothetical protein
MQDSLQIQALLERCRALELREVQLSTERDTIKYVFLYTFIVFDCSNLQSNV